MSKIGVTTKYGSQLWLEEGLSQYSYKSGESSLNIGIGTGITTEIELDLEEQEKLEK